jgi:hypothetical protein
LEELDIMSVWDTNLFRDLTRLTQRTDRSPQVKRLSCQVLELRWMRTTQGCWWFLALSTESQRETPQDESRNLEGFDYWEVHPARGAISRVHVAWRRSLYNPAELPEGVVTTDLQKVRITQKEFSDGTADVEEEEWGETPRESNTGVTRKTPGAWRGTTWFFLENVRPVPGPPGRRIVGKKPPLFVTEEWELLKKLRTDPEFRRGALVDSLSVAGIERQQLAAAQRVCPDLRVAYLGKLAESLSRPAEGPD